MCGLVAPEPLVLSWWPLLRDSSFYALSLAALWIVFADARVHFFEAVILFALYVFYACFMARSERVEARVEAWLARRASSSRSAVVGASLDGASTGGEHGSLAGRSSGGTFLFFRESL